MEDLSQKKLSPDAGTGRGARRGPEAPGAPEVVVVGSSAGGVHALGILLASLPAGFAVPVVVVQHRHATQDESFLEIFRPFSPLTLKEAEDKEPLAAGTVAFAPANYHLLIERDRTFALSTDAKVVFSRPSIDVLFESAAGTYGPAAAGVVLTGASRDGSLGLAAIAARGGLAIVQDPATAEHPFMPRSALEAVAAARVLRIEDIGPHLVRLVQGPAADAGRGRRNG